MSFRHQGGEEFFGIDCIGAIVKPAAGFAHHRDGARTPRMPTIGPRHFGGTPVSWALVITTGCEVPLTKINEPARAVTLALLTT
jgi:hypothetical protein